MKTVRVKIIGLRGETGLRKDGQIVPVPAGQAKHWVKMGWAAYLKKESKAKIETKEEKHKPTTKRKTVK